MTGTSTVHTQTLTSLPLLPRNDSNQIISSPELKLFLKREFAVRLDHATVSYEDEFLVIDYQAPGKATIIEIDQELGEAFIETTHFGLIAVLNDLHKGRHVDIVLSWLIDVSAVILILFSLAGFILLLPNKRRFKRVFFYSGMSVLILTAGYYLGNI